jgi:threonyl-tRNA synthetase
MGKTSISQTDYDHIEKEFKKFAQDKQAFERIVLTKQ